MKPAYLIAAMGIMTTALLGTGCMKSTPSLSTSTATTTTNTASSKIVYTPFGPRYASDVIALNSGAHLKYSGDHLLEVDRTGTPLRDLGKQEPLPYVRELMGNTPSKQTLGINSTKGFAPGSQPVMGSGWITYAELPQQNPVTYFSTTWKVPDAPASSGSLVYIFNGLEDASFYNILQPVLQYGVGPDGGGNYWLVNNWYASCSTCGAIYSTPYAVSTGTTITGLIQQTGQATPTEFTYSSTFTQYPGSTLSVESVPACIYPFETLEAYSVTSLASYPPDNDVAMTAINLQAGGVYPTLYWTPVDAHTEVGQHTVVVSNANPGGEVDLYFTNPIGGAGRYAYTTNGASGSGTITALPGQWIPVSVSASGTPHQTFSITMTLSGATFYTANSSVINAIDGFKVDGFYMPASGSVGWTSHYNQTGPGGSGSVTIN